MQQQKQHFIESAIFFFFFSTSCITTGDQLRARASAWHEAALSTFYLSVYLEVPMYRLPYYLLHLPIVSIFCLLV